METIDLVAVGEIIKAQGINGEFKVIPLTENIERFGEIHRVYWKTPDGLKELFIQRYRPFKEFVLLKFIGIDTLTEADLLGRGLIFIPRSERPKLPEGRYYYDEIEGLDVFAISGDYLGKIDQIITTGSNDVYSVSGSRGSILIPALQSVIKLVEIEHKRMVVQLPAGLLEEER